MENHNLPEAIAKRANQEDPIVMYLIVRESLNMSPGKLGVQCGHAAQIVVLKFIEEREIVDAPIQCPARDRLDIFTCWLDSSFRKVTLTADDKEWKKVQEAFVEGIMRFTVIDAGLTEIPAGSETVIAIWPMRKSQRPKILQKLQTLK
jgi:peptidyl-tRNA hydrolase